MYADTTWDEIKSRKRVMVGRRAVVEKTDLSPCICSIHIGGWIYGKVIKNCKAGFEKFRTYRIRENVPHIFYRAAWEILSFP